LRYAKITPVALHRSDFSHRCHQAAEVIAVEGILGRAIFDKPSSTERDGSYDRAR
jgi:hypothetical protein